MPLDRSAVEIGFVCQKLVAGIAEARLVHVEVKGMGEQSGGASLGRGAYAVPNPRATPAVSEALAHVTDSLPAAMHQGQ
jgi:hypothetical protein